MYLFLGISIIADIFMEGIEVITSQTKTIQVVDREGKTYMQDVAIWNATLANLTLMALGSSAPEILLSIIETLNTLGEPAGELGPSTIVGSAAFNLLVITAVCIVSTDAPKKIYDLGVFATTSVFSIFAYIWLYICLEDNVIETFEAWMTLGFFFILCILAFAADKYNQYLDERAQTLEEIEEKNKKDELNIKKSRLRNIVRLKGE